MIEYRPWISGYRPWQYVVNGRSLRKEKDMDKFPKDFTEFEKGKLAAIRKHYHGAPDHVLVDNIRSDRDCCGYPEPERQLRIVPWRD